ncbi:hypothetical protein HPB50_023301 [Hyalomma asiaticum]|uniref:Uncharacterized protein n=1 Tax=Hyalomma asiaticum TaxID=266040 RepID=A0ACB7TPU1_HYAAI|nr:hypothetical protein HPB50_023301 [Hyalomma asiaticum]
MDVQRWAADREVLLMGDFNGHLQALDGFQDFNGDLVDLTARDLNLEIANLRDDCEGEFTWCARNSRSCIDYVLMSPKLSRHVTSVTIDEDGKFSVGSDHNRMKLTFSTSTWRQKRRDRREPAARYLYRKRHMKTLPKSSKAGS